MYKEVKISVWVFGEWRGRCGGRGSMRGRCPWLWRMALADCSGASAECPHGVVPSRGAVL